MRRHVPVVAAVALMLPLVGSSALGSFHETLGDVADREFVLVMQGHAFNGFTWPDTPLLEAYLGERVGFTVFVPPLAEPHTFHLHGHPWLFEEKGRVIDTFLHRPGDLHRFIVPAGGVDRYAGDWMYHCHVDEHVEGGMWGIFRVYEYATRVELTDDGLSVRLDRLGVAVDGATLRVEVDGARVAADVDALGDGRYSVRADLPASGVLVVTATHAEVGASVARVGLGGVEVPLPTAAGGWAPRVPLADAVADALHAHAG